MCDPQPLARPTGVKFDTPEGEEIIALPARPPIVVMASWCSGLAARELARLLAPAPFSTLSFSRLLSARPLHVYAGGLALFGASAALFVRTVLHMNKAQTPVPHSLGVAQKICKDGPFRIFRHPIYIGFLGSTAAVTLMLDSLYASVGPCISAGYIVGHVMPVEEAWMRKKFGREWEVYCATTKRWVLF